MGNKKGLGTPGNWNIYIYVIIKWKLYGVHEYKIYDIAVHVLKITFSILQKST